MCITYNIIQTLYDISLKVDYGKFDTLNPKITSKTTKNHLIGQQRKWNGITNSKGKRKREKE